MTNEEIDKAARSHVARYPVKHVMSGHPIGDYDDDVEHAFAAGAHFYRDEMAKEVTAKGARIAQLEEDAAFLRKGWEFSCRLTNDQSKQICELSRQLTLLRIRLKELGEDPDKLTARESE